MCHAPRTGEGSLMILETFETPHSRNLGGAETRPSHFPAWKFQLCFETVTSTCQLAGTASPLLGLV